MLCSWTSRVRRRNRFPRFHSFGKDYVWVSNTWFCRHKHGWKMSRCLVKISSGFVFPNVETKSRAVVSHSAARVLTNPDMKSNWGNVLKHRNLTNLWFAVKHNATILFRQLGWFSLVGTLTKHSFPLTPSFLCACQKFRVVVIMTKAAPPASHTAYGVLTGQLFKPCQESLFLDNPAYDGDMIRHKCRSQPKCSQTKWRIMNLKL